MYRDYRWLAQDAFEEGKHPRDHGKFSTSQGGGTIASLRKIKLGENNQLAIEEQVKAKDKLSKLPTETESAYAQAYNQSSVLVEHLGMKDDHWEPMGERPGSTASEKFSRVMAVPLQGIGTSQDAVSKAGLSAYISRMPDPKKHLHPEVAVTPDGKFHLLSGHTRAGAAALGGREHLIARVWKFDNNNKMIRDKF